MLIVRGTKKLRDRMKGAPAGDSDDESTTVLGDWFVNALFWKPQVALLVNSRTFLPVYVPLAPAKTLLDRIPDAIESALRAQGVPEETIAAERSAMSEVRLAPTNDRTVVGVMNEFAYLGEVFATNSGLDLEALSMRMSDIIVGPLDKRAGTPGRELAVVLGTDPAAANKRNPFAQVIALFNDERGQEQQPASPKRAARDARKTGTEQAATAKVFQLKVTLRDIKPQIWRRVLVDGSATLDEVHDVIQAAFGWWNSHLHEFRIGGRDYGVPDPDWDMSQVLDETRYRLDELAAEGNRFRYVYDFGDNWDHDVHVEKVIARSEAGDVPACIAGKRACPPEDCGGTWGYEEFLVAIADPSHERHAVLIEWSGGEFDPEAFDPAEFDDNLHRGDLASFFDD
jgi:hypothetical protein